MSEQTYYPQPPGGGFFQNVGFGGALGPLDPDFWRAMNKSKQNVANTKDLPKGFWSKGDNPLNVSPIEAAGIPLNPVSALNTVNKSGILGTETEEVGGTMVGKNRPTGLGRLITGGIDALGLGTDLDRQGDGGGKINPNSGFGGIADTHKKDKEGEIVLDTEDADKKKKIEEEEREEESWGRKVDKLAGIGKVAQRNNMLYGGLTGAGESIMEGTLRGVDSLDRAQAATAQMVSNLPTLQLTAMKYAQGQNYGLG